MNSLYIHFPFCKHLCNYCDFYKYKLLSQDQIKEFQDRLLTNIKLNEDLLSRNKEKLENLKTIYIGGGTPSLWGKSGPNFIKEKVIDRYKLDDEYEFTIEIDPDSWTKEEIQKWIDVGVNRFSIGAQSFDPQFIRIMDRQHNQLQIVELLTFLNSIEANYSIDLMLGLPESKELKRDIEKELLSFIEFNPSHFSVYILKTRKNYPHNNSLPDEDYIEAEYLKTCHTLDKHGFKQYEVSNFAKNERTSKHNLMYWACESVGALGANATGLISRNKVATRYQYKPIKEDFHLEELNEEELLVERVYMGLRSKLGFDFSSYDRENIDKVFDRWKKLDYVKSINDYHVELNSKGYLMLDSLMSDLFSYNLV